MSVRRELARLWAEDDGRVGGSVRIAREGGALELAWELRLAAPPRGPAAAPGFLDGLWEHDVVELFVGGAGGRYLEVEAAASGHWLSIGFEGVRRRSALLPGLALDFEHAVAGLSWDGKLALPMEAVRAAAGPEPWRVLACAALDVPRRDGTRGRAFLAWPALPGARPDFHQPAAWAPLA